MIIIASEVIRYFLSYFKGLNMSAWNNVISTAKMTGDSRLYYGLRSKKDMMVRMFFKPLLKVNADFVTSAGLVSGVISITFLNSSHLIFLSFWGITRVLDIIDGTLYRSNYKTWIKGVNLDKYADIIYDSLLTLAVMPYTGILLAISSIVARIIHIRMERRNWANNFLAPHGGFTQLFFIFRMFREGVIIQTFYSFFTPLFKRYVLKKNYKSF